jgi:hypothetical protein
MVSVLLQHRAGGDEQMPNFLGLQFADPVITQLADEAAPLIDAIDQPKLVRQPICWEMPEDAAPDSGAADNPGKRFVHFAVLIAADWAPQNVGFRLGLTPLDQNVK